MRLSTKLSSIVAVGGVAALGAGLISSGGIGAAFSDQLTVQGTVNVGQFGCSLSSTDSRVDTSTNGNSDHSATLTLDDIKSSTAGSQTAPVTVTNDGDSALIVMWRIKSPTVTPDNGHIRAVPAAQALKINPGKSRSYSLGFAWDELQNTDLGAEARVKYEANCFEAPSSAHPQFVVITHEPDWSATGASEWLNDSHFELTAPANAYVTNIPAGTQVPSTQPTFTSDFYYGGAPGPRWDIRFENGKQLAGYYDTASAEFRWNADGNGYTDWADAYAIAKDWNVTTVTLSGAGSGQVYTLSCAVYGGWNYITNQSQTEACKA